MVARRSPRISVDGVFLDEVKTRVQYPGDANTIAYSSLPAHKHRLTPLDDILVIRTPAVTALQLYHDGVLPGDPAQGIEVMVGDEVLGCFVLDSLRRPHDLEFEQPVLLRFVRVESRSA